MTVQEWLGEDNQIGIDIWTKKYQQNNESFDEWIERVSGGNKYIARLILDKKFLFGGRILANRGMEKLGRKVTFSNCYVEAPPNDNIESIFQTASNIARTFSYGGGVGVDLSQLAPRGSKINNTAKETTGAVSFMSLYSLVSELIGQSGRRGALMLSLHCEHPDLEEFIEVKSNLDAITKANISVRVTKQFMEYAKDNKDFLLNYYRPESNQYVKKTINARDMLMKLSQMNWNMGEPGVLFWDQIEKYNMLSEFDSFSFAGVNPCGEEPLPAGGSCLLGSLNLSEFITDNEFDFKSFSTAVAVAVTGLNEVLDEGLELHPLQTQRDTVKDYRQIGLGIMGLADMLIKLGIEYGSEESLDLCHAIGNTMAHYAILQSSQLAKQYGSFDKYDYSLVEKSEFFQNHYVEEVKTNGLRNSQILTIAPTGTLSTMLGISGGMEPIYDLSYTRKTESLHGEDMFYKIYTPIVGQYMNKNGLLNESELPDFFVTSKTIRPINRIQMQSTWQYNIDASISSTVNLPETATVEDVFDVYMQAYLYNLKGITVFRENCERTGVLTTDKNEPEKRGELKNIHQDVVGKKRILTTGCGSLHCLAWFSPDTGDLVDIYLPKGSTGGCNSTLTGLSRMLSLASRAGATTEDIIDQLNSSPACPSYVTRNALKKDASRGNCCPTAIANAIIEMEKEMKAEIKNKKSSGVKKQPIEFLNSSPTKSVCPECGSDVAMEGGCSSCKSCGYSKCG